MAAATAALLLLPCVATVLAGAASVDTQDSVQTFVDLQNAARADVGVAPIAWDDTVAAYATRYAGERKGDCDLVHSGGPYGENLFWGSWGANWTASDAVASWVAEKQYYNCSDGLCAASGGMVCKHYTQVVWANTTRVGCATVTCDGRGGTFIVCEYDPPGNAPGARPYAGCGQFNRSGFDADEPARDIAGSDEPAQDFAGQDPDVAGQFEDFDQGGIDGVGLGLIRHHERLAKMFEMWCLHIPVEDRTSFEGLLEYVERTVKSESSRAPGRPVYLVGESVGACIALAVAARNPDIDLVLILVNPGTSFHKSQLQPLSGFLDLVPEPFHLSTPQFLNFLTGNFMKMPSTFVGRGFSLGEAGQALSEITTSVLPSLTFLVDILPKESIVWKLKMLRTASSFVNSRLHAVKAQTLVLASGNDELLPSREEAERLRGTLEKCRIRHFKDNGHKILLEGEFDLATTIKGAGNYRRSRRTDFVSDFLPPTPDELEKAMDRDRILSFATNPVMLSTLPDGKIVRGLAGLPKEGPAVLVGYHMLMGFELGPLVTGVLNSTGIHIRGLAHPFMFDKNSEQLMPDSSHFDFHRIMGAVPVTAVNFYKLLSEKHFVLLYPGGAREALHRKGEEYELFWPEQSEFVRMASRFGATIIPFGVVGEDDICDVLLDYNDLLKLPFYDILDKTINEDGLKLRTDSTGEIKNQGLHPVVLTPKLPGRFYFIFGKPIETKGREELRDKENAQRLYLHVKSEVASCIKYLKEKREEDPYRSIVPRLLYQAVHGLNAEIPTFEP